VEPGVQRCPQVGVAEGRDRAPALGVPAHHHLLHAEMRDGILDDRGGAHVVGMHAVRDVAVHEDVAGQAVADGRLRDAAVCAAYPQDLGPLALCVVEEGIRICLGGLLREHEISGYDAVDWV
jgi:hypothetical protein